jgi:hypothetical protein
MVEVMPLIIRSHIVYPAKPKAEEKPRSRRGVRRDAKPWTAHDDALLLKCYDEMGAQDLAERMGRSTKALSTRIQILRRGCRYDHRGTP